MDELERLRAKIKGLEAWLAGAIFFLVFLVIASTVTWNNMNEENEAAMETISELEDELGQARQEYNELEGVVQGMDEYIATLEEQVYFQVQENNAYSGGSTYSQSETQTITVYVTNTGSKYHKNGCQYLSQSKNAISLSDAKAAGYTACSRCY